MKKQPTVRHSVSHVRFSPKEMAYDPSPQESERWPIVACGMKQWKNYMNFKRGYIRLDPKVLRFYRDSQTVEKVLKKIMETDAVVHGKP